MKCDGYVVEEGGRFNVIVFHEEDYVIKIPKKKLDIEQLNFIEVVSHFLSSKVDGILPCWRVEDCLIQEKAKGVCLDTITDEKLIKHIKVMVDNLFEEALALGYDLHDRGKKNFFYDHHEDRIYMVDYDTVKGDNIDIAYEVEKTWDYADCGSTFKVVLFKDYVAKFPKKKFEKDNLRLTEVSKAVRYLSERVEGVIPQWAHGLCVVMPKSKGIRSDFITEKKLSDYVFDEKTRIVSDVKKLGYDLKDTGRKNVFCDLEDNNKVYFVDYHMLFDYKASRNNNSRRRREVMIQDWNRDIDKIREL